MKKNEGTLEAPLLIYSFIIFIVSFAISSNFLSKYSLLVSYCPEQSISILIIWLVIMIYLLHNGLELNGPRTLLQLFWRSN